jgi:predicted hydrocarbon binding protein
MILPVHGVILGSFSDYVSTRYGDAALRAVFRGEPIFLMSEQYDDDAFARVLERAGAYAGRRADEIQREFGDFAARTTFARLYPAYFSIAGSARNFLLTVEDRIHELVRATVPNARPPELQVSERGEDGVRIVYTSPRRLCALLVGLVHGTAAHYGERAEVEETGCVHEGAPACVFDVSFSRP